MAVIQISKIQLRRGREQEEGIPQLSSGELAWAVDTQRLYIGNGAVSEGAPQVGNTRILTDKDNIFELAQDYQYKESNNAIQTGLLTNYPVQLTLQQKLDETVTSQEYGIVPDATDQAAKIQNAIDNLFLNPSLTGRNDYKITLEFLPGTYFVSTTIFIPSYVTIKGAGIDKTVFQFTGSNQSVFRFIADTSTKNSRQFIDDENKRIYQPKYIHLSDFTIITGEPTVDGFRIENVRDSVFENIKIVGSYDDSSSNESKGLDLRAFSSIATTERNHFNNLFFDGIKYPIYSKYDIKNNKFSHCIFTEAYIGVYFYDDGIATGEEFGPRFNLISDSTFSRIERQGIFIEKGYGNLSRTNTFVDVGNEFGGNDNNQTACVRFESHGNSSVQDIFDRRVPTEANTGDDLSSENFGEIYLSEVQGKVFRDVTTTQGYELGYANSPTQILRIPVDSDAHIAIDYLLRSQNYNQVRKGTIHLVVDYLDINTISQHVRLVDDYEFVGEEFDDDNIIFTASINLGNVFLSYVNFNGNDTSTFECKYRYIN
jgi:hypothetical protein